MGSDSDQATRSINWEECLAWIILPGALSYRLDLKCRFNRSTGNRGAHEVTKPGMQSAKSYEEKRERWGLGTNIKRDSVTSTNFNVWTSFVSRSKQTVKHPEQCEHWLDTLLYWGITVKTIIDNDGIVIMTLKESPSMSDAHSEIFLNETIKCLGFASN